MRSVKKYELRLLMNPFVNQTVVGLQTKLLTFKKHIETTHPQPAAQTLICFQKPQSLLLVGQMAFFSFSFKPDSPFSDICFAFVRIHSQLLSVDGI